MRKLFVLFRNEVLSLNPCVSERLRLSLNILFHELQDLLGITKEVTNIGRWGNGDMEVALNGPEEQRDMMGVVRQALEMQLGNEETES